MSMAVLNRQQPQAAPDGFEEFDQTTWLEEQMRLSRQFANMYSADGDGESAVDVGDGFSNRLASQHQQRLPSSPLQVPAISPRDAHTHAGRPRTVTRYAPCAR